MADLLVGYFTASKQLNQLTIANHGLINGDTVRFVLGAPGNTLPAPLIENVWCYVVSASSDTFQVSLTSELVEPTYKPDLAEVNYYAQRGWELMLMGQVAGALAQGGRFWYLMRKQEPAGV